MPIHQYYHDLQEIELCKKFRTINDVFLGKLVFELQGHENNKLFDEGIQVIQVYGYFYIQFPKFTYLKIGGFSGEPLKFLRYYLDSIILLEICRKFVSVIESFENTKKSSSVFFPIEIGHYRCPSLKQPMLTKEALARLCFKPFFPQESFDYSGFVKRNF